METQHVLDDQKLRATIGRHLGISQQAVMHWRTRGIPPEHCPDIEALTGIPCEVLRPGVNWSVLRRPAPKAPRKAKAA
jgi:DNA-binding transcriptional regulator YdaS (Cro superfamily)